MVVIMFWGQLDICRRATLRRGVKACAGYINSRYLHTILGVRILQHLGRPGKSVAAIEMIVRSVSKGGVGAKVASSPGPRICRATSRDRMLGFALSPLFTSTHLTLMGPRPITRRHSLKLAFRQTPFDSKYANSFNRASRTSTGSSGWPVKSSL